MGDSNLLALASHIATPYYIGYGTAAAHYGLTTQHRNVIFVVTPAHAAGAPGRGLAGPDCQSSPKANSSVSSPSMCSVHKVMMSDREKTAIDCIDRPALAGGAGEAAAILATASRRFDWNKAADYLERIGSGALVRRFGWLVDHVKAEIPPAVRDRLLRLAGAQPQNMARTRSRARGSGRDRL